MKTTIIIPHWNQADLLGRCLELLEQRTPHFCASVLVIDNGSTDHTPEVLRRHPLVRSRRLDSNRGFAVACNIGASMAETPYICFLNNDTEAKLGWLHPLEATLDAEPDVAAVGPKLLYPNGKIQSGGVRIYRNAKGSVTTAAEMFRGEPGDHPAANTRRDSAITGACLLVRRSVFWDVAGFDERFRNGLEDVDLNLKLHQAGHRTVYEPASAVIHHCGASGRERHRYHRQNKQLLREKWRAA
ncbi:N-acetylglucosaminyl-diphospho-decaprenol L-rhamnosyltransferase [Planctomycetes bacterium Pan216]|uniref:N-acetylglucosaminyl-diphospho-decaprenol L-rhamnosyltransferase n=1 Tax=Kolteria novifilia TaxID=2527975 RepID=A0A518AZ35_9BACT|nr:N-acetylglucosaminyl-diphospho-decaprenol L-rhamnosyltransferase [Planctomycetes bacterium Pan216]